MSIDSPETPETDQPEFAPPPQTSNRDYDEPQPESLPLHPMSPREKELRDAFRKTIRHYLEFGGITTMDEFSDKLSLELWRLTRK